MTDKPTTMDHDEVHNILDTGPAELTPSPTNTLIELSQVHDAELQKTMLFDPQMKEKCLNELLYRASITSSFLTRTQRLSLVQIERAKFAIFDITARDMEVEILSQGADPRSIILDLEYTSTEVIFITRGSVRNDPRLNSN